MRRRALQQALLLTVLVAVAAGLGAGRSGLLDRMEHDSVAARFAVRGPQPVGDVAVIGIDDVTFSDLHLRWPFPRRLHARALDALRRAGARLVVYDVQFTEPSDAADDGALYAAVRRAGPRVVLVTSEADAHGRTNVLGGDANVAEAHARVASGNLPAHDGRLERVPAASGALRTVASVTAATLGRWSPARRWAHGGARIDYAGPPGTVPAYSFSDLLAGRVPARELRGRVVVVGATAPTLQDVHATPVSHGDLMAGPEVQANAIRTALRRAPLHDTPAWATVLAAALVALATAALALRLRPWLTALAAVPVALAWLAVAQVLFDHGLVAPVAPPLVSLLVAVVGVVATFATLERRGRERADDRNAELERLVRERTDKLRATQDEMLERLAHAVESRDGETGLHIGRMSAMCERVALGLGWSAELAARLRHAAALHDLGKLAVPDAILHKNGPLDDAERAVMQTHASAGADLLKGSPSDVVRLAEVVARTHHERWDGTGYPAGLAGEAIPVPGRIAAACDVLDALLSERPYKAAWSLEEAVAELRAQAGRQFDPAVVEALLRVLDDPRAVASLELPAARTPRAVAVGAA